MAFVINSSPVLTSHNLIKPSCDKHEIKVRDDIVFGDQNLGLNNYGSLLNTNTNISGVLHKDIMHLHIVAISCKLKPIHQITAVHLLLVPLTSSGHTKCESGVVLPSISVIGCQGGMVSKSEFETHGACLKVGETPQRNGFHFWIPF